MKVSNNRNNYYLRGATLLLVSVHQCPVVASVIVGQIRPGGNIAILVTATGHIAPHYDN